MLGTLDDKIELNRRMSETLESMARALFKSWFVDFDPVTPRPRDPRPSLAGTLLRLVCDHSATIRHLVLDLREDDQLQHSGLGVTQYVWEAVGHNHAHVLQGAERSAPKSSSGISSSSL